MPKEKARIRLEPELEIQVVTFTPSQRRALARIYLRWARQLFVSAKILDGPSSSRTERRHLRPLHPRKAALN